VENAFPYSSESTSRSALLDVQVRAAHSNWTETFQRNLEEGGPWETDTDIRQENSQL
jgi:hypothetical protein